MLSIFVGISKVFLFICFVFFIFFAENSLASQVRRTRDGNRRVWVSKAFKSEDEALEFMLEHSIPIISLESPNDKDKFKKKLKSWNPQIENWKSIGAWEPIYVYLEKPIYEISVGGHLFQNDETLSTGAVINTENKGIAFDLKLTFPFDLELFTYMNYRLLQKNNFQLEGSSRVYSIPMNHSIELGFTRAPMFSRWSYGLSLEGQQFSFMSFNSEKYRVLRLIEENLQVSQSDIIWGAANLNYRFSLMGYGTYLLASGAYSLYGNKSLEDGSLEEDVTAYRFRGSIKQYLKYSLWLNFYYQVTKMSGVTKTSQTQYGAYLGTNF